MPEPLRFGAVILAAGGSTRMGSPKPLLPIGGRPLLIRVVEATLESGAEPVIVVVGAEAARLRALLSAHPVLVAENAQWSEGMASSLHTGLARLVEATPAIAAAVMVLCDQPHFSSDSIRRLVEAQRTTGCSIAAARYGGRNGAPALFQREHFPSLCALTGDQGARALLNGDAAAVAAVEMPELEADLDTPADYAAAVRRLPSR